MNGDVPREDNVIDNKEVILKDELEKFLPKTGMASIAVGYFFISGLSAIIKPLKDASAIRLLISNTTDKATAEALIEGFHSIDKARSKITKMRFVNKAPQHASKDVKRQAREYGMILLCFPI